MARQVTLKDVAREAHVSVATVSYIINNREDQKISDATRKKVLQIANLLGYTPNPVAKSLVTGRKDLVGIVYRLRDNTPSRNLELFHFIDLLVKRLNSAGCECILLPADVTDITLKRVDSVIALGLSAHEFATLSDNCFVPILTVDMLVNDDLFSQIYSDLPALIGEPAADALLVTEPYGNENYDAFVRTPFGDDRMLTPRECTPDRTSGRALVILGAPLALAVAPLSGSADITVITSDPTAAFLPPDYKVIHADVQGKADVTAQYVLDALNGKFEFPHDRRV